MTIWGHNELTRQWKHLNNVWSLFKVNNIDTRTTVMTSLPLFSKKLHSLFWRFIIDFEQLIAG